MAKAMNKTEFKKGFTGIEKRSNGTFKITLPSGTDPETGKQIRKYETFVSTKKTDLAQWKEAQAYRTLKLEEIHKNTRTDGNITFKAFFEEWKKKRSTEIELNTNGCLTIGQYQQYCANIERVFIGGCKDSKGRARIESIGNKRMKDIDINVMQDFTDSLGRLGYAPKTVKKYISCVRDVFKYAIVRKVIPQNCNPCTGLDYVKDKGNSKIHVFNEEQQNTFYNALENGIVINKPEIIRKNGRRIPATSSVTVISTQYRLLFTMAFKTGLRLSELIGLQWSNIDRDNKVVHVDHATGRQIVSTDETGNHWVMYDKECKNQVSYRDVPLMPCVIELLNEWENEQRTLCQSLGTAWEGVELRHFTEQFVFITSTGAQMSIHTPNKKFKSIIKQINLELEYKAEENPDSKEYYLSQRLPDIHFHDIRHTFNSWMKANGVDEETRKALMGHSEDSEVNNKVYSHRCDTVETRKLLAKIFGEVLEKTNISQKIDISPEEYEAFIRWKSSQSMA